MRVPVNHRMPEALRLADVEDERQGSHGVADQTDERRRPCDGLEAL